MHPDLYRIRPAHSLRFLHVLRLLRKRLHFRYIVRSFLYRVHLQEGRLQPFLALLMFLPLINIIMLYFLAFRTLECRSRGQRFIRAASPYPISPQSQSWDDTLAVK